MVILIGEESIIVGIGLGHEVIPVAINLIVIITQWPKVVALTKDFFNNVMNMKE